MKASIWSRVATYAHRSIGDVANGGTHPQPRRPPLPFYEESLFIQPPRDAMIAINMIRISAPTTMPMIKIIIGSNAP